MADKRPGSDTTTRKRRSSLPNAVIGAVDDLVTAAQAPAAPVPKKARRKIKKLGKELDAVRAMEAKRLRQSAKARQVAARRDRQAAEAAARMASLVTTIRDTAAGSIAATPKSATAAGAKPAAATNAPRATKPAGKPAGATKAATTANAATRRRTTATPAPKPVRRAQTTTRTPKPKPSA